MQYWYFLYLYVLSFDFRHALLIDSAFIDWWHTLGYTFPLLYAALSSPSRDHLPSSPKESLRSLFLTIVTQNQCGDKKTINRLRWDKWRWRKKKKTYGPSYWNQTCVPFYAYLSIFVFIYLYFWLIILTCILYLAYYLFIFELFLNECAYLLAKSPPPPMAKIFCILLPHLVLPSPAAPLQTWSESELFGAGRRLGSILRAACTVTMVLCHWLLSVCQTASLWLFFAPHPRRQLAIVQLQGVIRGRRNSACWHVAKNILLCAEDADVQLWKWQNPTAQRHILSHLLFFMTSKLNYSYFH